MKNKILILLAFVFSMISFSCETVYLDASPTASIDAGAAYSTTKNAAAAINGIYRSFVVRKGGRRAPQQHSTHGLRCTPHSWGCIWCHRSCSAQGLQLCPSARRRVVHVLPLPHARQAEVSSGQPAEAARAAGARTCHLPHITLLLGVVARPCVHAGHQVQHVAWEELPQQPLADAVHLCVDHIQANVVCQARACLVLPVVL